MKFKSAFIVLLAVLVISTLIGETESQGSRSDCSGNHFINKRGARKVRDILLPCRKAMDAEDKKK